MSKDRQEYHGDGFTISFAPERCIHAAVCVKGNREVFDAKRKPWIEPDAASAETITGIVSNCPSGALEIRDASGARLDNWPEQPEMRARTNGPLEVRGQIELKLRGGATETVTRATLCRCGATKNAPFCDGSHNRLGNWEKSGKADG